MGQIESMELCYLAWGARNLVAGQVVAAVVLGTTAINTAATHSIPRFLAL